MTEQPATYEIITAENIQAAYNADHNRSFLGAHLEGANLEDAHLEDAHLEDAHLEDAYLRGAYLEGAHLEGAHLEGAYLRDANLRGAYLRGAKFSPGSHDVISELLRQAATTVQRRMIAGLVIVSRDWCWKEFAEQLAIDYTGEWEWALAALEPWECLHEWLASARRMGEIFVKSRRPIEKEAQS